MVKTEKRKINTCNLCGWTWTQRRLISNQCPHCKNGNWNEPIKNKKAQKKEVVLDE